jgi:hypothetical protein
MMNDAAHGLVEDKQGAGEVERMVSSAALSTNGLD